MGKRIQEFQGGSQMIPNFRAWDIVKKAMNEVQAIVYTEKKVYPIYSKVIRRYVPFSETVLMQSTDLFDKNGVEIYEGDIVSVHTFKQKHSISGGVYEDEEIYTGEIVYEHPNEDIFGKVYPKEWGLKINDEFHSIAFIDGLHEESFQVLGNIYENPDLMKTI